MNARVLASGLSVALLAACTSFGTTPEPAMDDAGLVDGSLPSVGADGAALDGASPGDPDATTGRDGGRDGGEPRGWGAIFVSKGVTKGALGDSQRAADSLCGAEGQAVKPGATFVALLSVAAGDGLSARLRGSRGPRHVLGPGGARGARAIADVGAAGAVLGPVKTHADGSAVVQARLDGRLRAGARGGDEALCWQWRYRMVRGHRVLRGYAGRF